MSKIIASKNERIDIFLANELNETRSKVSSLIKDKNVLVNNKEIKCSYKLNIGDEIKINYPEIKNTRIKFQVNFDVKIIYEDEHILVVNKPSGVATHGASSLKEASLVEWLLEKNYKLADINGNVRAGIVHRLDKDTSGIMVVAKSNEAYLKLAEQIKNRQIDRIYLAITNLSINTKSIEKYIKRNDKNRLKMQALSKDECIKKYGANNERWGKWAKTYFLNLFNKEEKNLIAAKLVSGRTHQIRVHLASINRFILGDTIYSKIYAKRLMLHSFLLRFNHPINNNAMCFIAECDDDFKECLKDFDDLKLDFDFANNILNTFKNGIENA